MLTHSPEYITAVIACALEYWIEILIVPRIIPNYYCHIPTVINVTGLLLCVVGEIVRKCAMVTTTTNFNHHVDTVHQKDHQLVTTGLYSWCRHPAYVGWFYWTLGTQLLLGNPLCLFGFGIVGYRFLHGRIVHEEKHLIQFFGEKYLRYQKTVASGIPFVKGYRIDE
ncbi:Protein-S-isoprenylcysteine O-methyltransferase [Fasciolopsis buskii]|uniref:Protein-S-isoprenylcysteine O-methyltransferase n=1 Tax=Fasciolopsis buskii TaxID=27845 RepID=A0A8E0VMC1_9TREM|nr:Protein-S-isoprenylcysteine O-methyltransferase [Fasciolopsis buski]